jgi:hypothetical protein
LMSCGLSLQGKDFAESSEKMPEPENNYVYNRLQQLKRNGFIK